MEDTLNNSNELFHSFRSEMEDMSKKTKKLEKENEVLRRKHEATSTNIVGMAEEREEWKKKAEAAEQRAAKLTSIIQQMQTQGRRAPASPTKRATTATALSPPPSDGVRMGSVSGDGGNSGASIDSSVRASTASSLMYEDALDNEDVFEESDTLSQQTSKSFASIPMPQGGMFVTDSPPASAPATETVGVPFGPERPPPPPQKLAVANGHRRV